MGVSVSEKKNTYKKETTKVSQEEEEKEEKEEKEEEMTRGVCIGHNQK